MDQFITKKQIGKESQNDEETVLELYELADELIESLEEGYREGRLDGMNISDTVDGQGSLLINQFDMMDYLCKLARQSELEICYSSDLSVLSGHISLLRTAIDVLAINNPDVEGLGILEYFGVEEENHSRLDISVDGGNDLLAFYTLSEELLKGHCERLVVQELIGPAEGERESTTKWVNSSLSHDQRCQLLRYSGVLSDETAGEIHRLSQIRNVLVHQLDGRLFLDSNQLAESEQLASDMVFSTLELVGHLGYETGNPFPVGFLMERFVPEGYTG
ncbi:hypothetical protein [Halarchaeum grantii]|nr:hypothetical protein [Halarchaeum grantii]